MYEESVMSNLNIIMLRCFVGAQTFWDGVQTFSMKLALGAIWLQRKSKKTGQRKTGPKAYHTYQ